MSPLNSPSRSARRCLAAAPRLSSLVNGLDAMKSLLALASAAATLPDPILPCISPASHGNVTCACCERFKSRWAGLAPKCHKNPKCVSRLDSALVPGFMAHWKLFSSSLMRCPAETGSWVCPSRFALAMASRASLMRSLCASRAICLAERRPNVAKVRSASAV